MEKLTGLKQIQINARCNFPIVSAFEFEHIKSESSVQEWLKPCTIYFIVQRPLIFINNMTVDEGVVRFEIDDPTNSLPLRCEYDLAENGFNPKNGNVLVVAEFYDSAAVLSQPFNGVAGFKLFDSKGEFLYWLSPERFIYYYLTGSIRANLVGDIRRYLNYNVHYIGQAFRQDVWDRLSGHCKMQSILTKERSSDLVGNMPSHEISLILLGVKEHLESAISPIPESMINEDVIIHEYDFEDDNDSFEKFRYPTIKVNAPELTNEVEALLISRFNPEYNDIKFDNYPKIKRGTRSLGFTDCSLVIDCLPASLKTEAYFQDIVI